MTPPASPRLPEAVEQALEMIHVARHTERAAGMADLGMAIALKPAEMGERIIQHHDDLALQRITALRAAILAYGAARERQGIERAARVVCRQCGEGSPVEWVPESSVHEPYRTAGWHHAVEGAYKGQLWCDASALRALPVDGATP